MEDHGAAADPRRLREAEHFLDADLEDDVAIAVLEAPPAPAGHHQGLGRLGVEAGAQLPRQALFQGAAERGFVEGGPAG